jgi:hypothetical protein
MPKGHSLLETEVKKLRVDTQLFQDASQERIADLEKLTDELLVRLQSLEHRFKDYRVSTADTAVRNTDLSYKPAFDKWPGNGSQP